MSWILIVLLGKVALQAAVVLTLTYVPLHSFVVHSLWGECAGLGDLVHARVHGQARLRCRWRGTYALPLARHASKLLAGDCLEAHHSQPAA